MLSFFHDSSTDNPKVGCSLPQHSINFWDEMRKVFLNQYTPGIAQPKSDHALASIRQRADEPLRVYLRKRRQRSFGTGKLTKRIISNHNNKGLITLLVLYFIFEDLFWSLIFLD
ncbi:MAG: hypothetical protein Q8877_02485 [Sweet potato little leaf phytoplasma]|nr:hypothetical protein [Sweet potato little leaf phytoplasma]